MEIVHTQSFALATVAAGDPNSPRLALVLPGRLDSKDYCHNIAHLNFLASAGYLAVSFDPPGTWDSPGGIELYSVTNYLRAVHELISYYGDRPTLLMGHSRGGTVALVAGSRNPFVTAMVAICAPHGGSTASDEPQMVDGREIHVSLRDLPPGDRRSGLKKRFELPRSYFEDSSQYNALELINDCEKPKLFFYGAEDPTVGEETVRRMFAEAAEPKALRALPGGHDYRLDSQAIAAVNAAVGNFLHLTSPAI